MDTVMYYICAPLGYLMKGCWDLLGNYGLSILLFTFFTKIVLLPLSVWVHKNSIRMVRIQPEVNMLKARFYGDRDRIAEEETKLYKRVKYSPLASSVPLLVQILLLMGVVYIIKEPLTHILHLDSQTIQALAGALGCDPKEEQLLIVERIQASGGALVSDLVSGEVLHSIQSLKLSFLGFSLGVEPYTTWGLYTLVPLVAGLSSLLLCWVQNAINVLQAEQSKLNKYGMTILSVGISLSLGFFVYSGVALYWVASNLLAIVQQLLLNWIIDPKKQVDYAALEASREELRKIETLDGGKKKDKQSKENARREKQDYKRFFKVVNKHVVIYSERSGFYKYFSDIIQGLLAHSNLTIHYITSDPRDAIFTLAQSNPRIRPYYIGPKKLITLMMKLDADIVLMTTPDLENYYIKRSLYRKDVEYVYLPHDMMSVHMGFRFAALDHFDTIFCTGPHVTAEVRATEKTYNLPGKTLIPFGYPLAESLAAAYEATEGQPNDGQKQEILIAPSWQEDNLLDSCVDTLIAQLLGPDRHLTVRPHPEYVKRYPERMQQLVERYKDADPATLSFELDFSSNTSIYTSDLLVTDWSGIAYEFCFATGKPALFINTQMKMENPRWQEIDLIPTEISLRDKVGISLNKDQLEQVGTQAAYLLSHKEAYHDEILRIREQHLYAYGTHGKQGVTYILNRLAAIQAQKKAAKS